MSFLNPITFFAVLILIFVFWYWKRLNKQQDSQNENHWLPNELKAGKLVMVEQDSTAHSSFNDNLISGRFDRVYEVVVGGVKYLVPADLKNRDNTRVFETDIAEVSLQAWMLRRNGHKTLKHGYIFIKNRIDGSIYPKRVALFDDDRCFQMISRYFNLVSHRVEPKKANSAKCTGCSHAKRCLR